MVLDEHQSAAVRSTAEALRIDAGPGTGKTEVVACRVAHLIESGAFPPSQIAALTYTRAMAADLRGRIAARIPSSLTCEACGGGGEVAGLTCSRCAGTGRMGVGEILVGTLHSVAARFARMALQNAISGGEAVRALGIVDRDSDTFTFADDHDLKALVDEAQRVVGKKKVTKKALKGGLGLYGAALEGWPKEAEARRLLLGRGLVTYDDVLRMFHALLQEQHGNAVDAAQTVSGRFPCLVLDERQDLTAEHWELVRLWDPVSLTAVGDGAQAIFGFLRGRDGGDGGARSWDQSSELVVNYRSRPDLVAAFNDCRARLVLDNAAEPLEQVPAREEAVGVVSLLPTHSQPETAVAAVEDLLAEFQPSDIAVLAPVWDTVSDVLQALRRRGIEASAPSSGKALWGGQAGRAMIAMMRMADRNLFDQRAAAAIITAGVSGAAAVAEATDRAYTEEKPIDVVLAEHGFGWWYDVVNAGSATDVASLAMKATIPGVADVAAIVLKWARIDPFADTPGEFLAWLAGADEALQEDEARGVTVRTIHGAKGLEWPAVVVCDCCEGAIPPPWGRKSRADEQEWARALFVALTRARDALYVVRPLSLRGKDRDATRWLPDMEEVFFDG